MRAQFVDRAQQRGLARRPTGRARPFEDACQIVGIEKVVGERDVLAPLVMRADHHRGAQDQQLALASVERGVEQQLRGHGQPRLVELGVTHEGEHQVRHRRELVGDGADQASLHVVELVEAKYRDAWRDRPVGRIGIGRILFAHRAETSA
ncbi:unannotated protein [freshwater metagenome]|uniref:Unannotated protein n=1 Tax=freshwater metagenome TaxID=449393 RepID=A0A6J7R1U6_9ZZZZ